MISHYNQRSLAIGVGLFLESVMERFGRSISSARLQGGIKKFVKILGVGPFLTDPPLYDAGMIFKKLRKIRESALPDLTFESSGCLTGSALTPYHLPLTPNLVPPPYDREQMDTF